KYVERRVLVAVHHQSTGGTDMGAYAQALGHALPTAATVLAGELGRNRHHSPTGPFCLVCEDGTERCPPGIADALGEVMVPDHIADLQIFQVDRVVRAHQGEGRLVVEVAPLALDLLLLLGASPDGFPPPFAAFLPARDTSLGLLQSLLGFAVVAGIVYDVAVRRDEKDLQPHVYARLASGTGQWLYGHLGAGERHIPAVRHARDRDQLGRALKQTMEPDGNTPDLGETEYATIQHGAVAILWIGEGVIAVLALEPGIARRLASRYSPEERLIGLFHSTQHVLQDLGVHLTVVGAIRFEIRQLVGLLIVCGADALPASPPRLALLQGTVI